MELNFLKESPYFVNYRKNNGKQTYIFKERIHLIVDKTIYWFQKKKDESVDYPNHWESPVWFRILFKKVRIEALKRKKLRMQIRNRTAIKKIVIEIKEIVALDYEDGKQLIKLNRYRKCNLAYLEKCVEYMREYDIDALITKTRETYELRWCYK